MSLSSIMGTRGLVVYRHKNLYFVRYNHYDSYPESLGVDVLREISTFSPDHFRSWLEQIRQAHDDILAQSPSIVDDVREFEISSGISRTQPRANIMLEWVYEVDLDNMRFIIGQRPYYNLDRLPPEGVFLDSLGRDHYGQSGPSPDLPEEYRLRIKVPGSIPVASEMELYHRVVETIHDMLGQTETLSNRMVTCSRMLEVVVCITMRCDEHPYPPASLLRDRSDFSTQLKYIGIMLIQLTVCPVLYARDQPTNQDWARNSLYLELDCWWVRKHICVHFAIHLDDDMNLKAAI